MGVFESGHEWIAQVSSGHRSAHVGGKTVDRMRFRIEHLLGRLSRIEQIQQALALFRAGLDQESVIQREFGCAVFR